MSRLKVFLVEDSPTIRENLAAALEELVPASVVGASDDEAGAVSWLTNPANECDLAIVDLALRRGSGLGVLNALRESLRPISRVVLTNYATPDVRRRCLNLGAAQVFDKSAEIDALVDYCQKLNS